MTGLVLLVAELTRRAAAAGTPSPLRPSPGRLIAQIRRRWLLAGPAGLAMLALTGWPVAAAATAVAVAFLPKMTAGGPARQQMALLEGLEQWTRRLADLLTASRGLEDA